MPGSNRRPLAIRRFLLFFQFVTYINTHITRFSSLYTLFHYQVIFRFFFPSQRHNQPSLTIHFTLYFTPQRRRLVFGFGKCFSTFLNTSTHQWSNNIMLCNTKLLLQVSASHTLLFAYV